MKATYFIIYYQDYNNACIYVNHNVSYTQFHASVVTANFSDVFLLDFCATPMVTDRHVWHSLLLQSVNFSTSTTVQQCVKLLTQILGVTVLNFKHAVKNLIAEGDYLVRNLTNQ